MTVRNALGLLVTLFVTVAPVSAVNLADRRLNFDTAMRVDAMLGDEPIASADDVTRMKIVAPREDGAITGEERPSGAHVGPLWRSRVLRRRARRVSTAGCRCSRARVERGYSRTERTVGKSSA